MQDMITVDHVSKRYGDKLAVDDLTFTVKPGIVTGFLGPNGAGKSTTMRMMLGLDAPTTGNVEVNGRAYHDLQALLHEIGAKYVVDSSATSFMDDLANALVETGATIAFDAIGGGKLAGQILTCMEIAANKTAKEYSRYGSTVHKQVYVYGSLDPRPIELNRAFGMAWGVGGWLLFPFLQKIGPADGAKLRQRVVSELKTTFASHYTQVVSLQEALQLSNIAVYNKRSTGEKFLINPNKGG